LNGTRGARGPAAKSGAVTTDALLERIGEGEVQAVYLVGGDRVLAEPAARRLAGALASRAGCTIAEHRRPASLRPLLSDLRTYSLFDAAKVVFVVESAIFADRAAAADLIDEAAEALPPSDGERPTSRETEAAGRLLLVLRLFDLQPEAANLERAEALLDRLPPWVLQGGGARRGRGSRGRGKKQVEQLRADLAALLRKALAAGVQGWVEGDLAELERAVEHGLPERHSLVLAESSVAAEHPLVARLRERGAFVDAGSLQLDRGGAPVGLEGLTAELRRETGASIRADGLAELSRRTLRKGAAPGEVDAESSSRFAAEYRKLAGLAQGGAITLERVREVVEDRGDEDVWKLLDDLGGGDAAGAATRLRRLLLHADDSVAARLSVWSLIADLCRQIAAVRSFLDSRAVVAGERNYHRFQDRLADALRAPLSGGADNPVANLHPYRLHRVYLAACRLRGAPLDRLPWRVLETEARLKGESGDPDAALFELVAALAAGNVEPESQPVR
jgi:DNA polymerase III delta subunit